MHTTTITDVVNDCVTTALFGDSEQVRACHFEHIEWFIGNQDNGLRSRMQVLFLDRDKLRHQQQFDYGPWAMRIDKRNLRHGSFAEVYHDCHALFPTVTRFYH